MFFLRNHFVTLQGFLQHLTILIATGVIHDNSSFFPFMILGVIVVIPPDNFRLVDFSIDLTIVGPTILEK